MKKNVKLKNKLLVKKKIKKITHSSNKKNINLEKKNSRSIAKSPKYIELRGFLSFFILHELNRGDHSGDELAEIIGKRKGTSLTPGTIYPALKRLRRQKLITFKRIGRKKVYSLTPLGLSELKALYSLFKGMFFGLRGKLR
ncbi:MAG: hypothetical protein KatS3mg002_0951 [Candidatus Woesearchaeota archaeon]|nr:MAG: hypothetical protein KatS3mg002_0951 [Candidatus Woesearchaeota archaeon]